ncbi:MAG: DVU_1556 family methyltransferase [Anaerovoracaceae bacterium]
MLRPGEFKMIDKAMEICKLPQGSSVLEVGCGTGDTTERLEKKYGAKVSAIDISLEMVRRTKERGLLAQVAYGDGEFLEDFPSFSFDLVVMECVLSLINKPDEALHEAYCTLKKGGMLFISDLSVKNPDPEQMKALAIEAERLAKKPKEYKECDDQQDEMRVVSFRHEGRFLLEPLKEALEEVGFRVIFTEDRSKDLEEYVAQQMMAGEDGDADSWDCSGYPKDTGYFMLIAQKPL